MTIHIGAKPGEIADTVLLPGDPLRAKWAAETFLQSPKCINEVRGMLGYTGTWKGNPVTIHGSGMGMPSLSIYVNELIKDFESANIYAADWYEAGTSHIAESQNQYRYIKVNIAPNKASLLVNFREDVNFEIFAVSPCYRIAKLIPYEKAAGWGSEKTTDEKALAKVFN